MEVFLQSCSLRFSLSTVFQAPHCIPVRSTKGLAGEGESCQLVNCCKTNSVYEYTAHLSAHQTPTHVIRTETMRAVISMKKSVQVFLQSCSLRFSLSTVFQAPHCIPVRSTKGLAGEGESCQLVNCCKTNSVYEYTAHLSAHQTPTHVIRTETMRAVISMGDRGNNKQKKTQ